MIVESTNEFTHERHDTILKTYYVISHLTRSMKG